MVETRHVSLAEVPKKWPVEFVRAEYDEPDARFASVIYLYNGRPAEKRMRVDLDKFSVLDAQEDLDTREAFAERIRDIWIKVMESRSADFDWKAAAEFYQRHPDHGEIYELMRNQELEMHGKYYHSKD